MDWITYVIAGLIAAGVIAVIVNEIVKKKKGKGSCSCGCQGCAMKDQCHK